MSARKNSAALWGSLDPSHERSSDAAAESKSTQLDILQQMNNYAKSAREDRLATEAALKKTLKLSEQASLDRRAVEDIWQKIQYHEGYAAACADRAEYSLQEAEYHGGQVSHMSAGIAGHLMASNSNADSARSAAAAAQQSSTRAARSAAIAAQSAATTIKVVEGRY